MDLKKVFALVLVCFFAMYSVGFAAVGGKRGGFSAPKKPSFSQQQKAPSKGDYKPSKDAKSLDKNAPAANSKTNAQAAAPQKQGSMMGNMMRNVGLLAGGMLLGSMLGSMFGMGEGMMADILGMLMNVVLLGAVFMIGRMLWTKFKNRNNDKRRDEENIYHLKK